MWLNVVKFQFQNTPRGPAAMTGRVSIGAQAPAATELYFSHIMMRSANNRDAIRCDAMRMMRTTWDHLKICCWVIVTMYRPVGTVPLPAAAQASLLESGFLYCEDIVSHRGILSHSHNADSSKFFTINLCCLTYVYRKSLLIVGVTSEAQNILHRWNLHSNDSWLKLTSPPSTSNALDVWQVGFILPSLKFLCKQLV